MVKKFRVGFAFFLALVSVGSFVSVSTVSPAWAVGAWTQVGSDIDGEAASDYSGSAVSFSSDGSRVAIGASENDGGGDESGQVRVYDLTFGAWVQVGGDINGEAAGDYSGQSVSLSSDGSRIAIGARFNDGGGDESGQVRVYNLMSGNWVQVGSDINGNAAGDRFGASVSLSSDGSRVAIGAGNSDGNGSNAGQVRVYDLTFGAWVQVGGDINGEAAGDYSGQSVSLSSDGSRVAIGANSGSSPGLMFNGYTRVFTLTGGNWVQLGSDIVGEANFGFSGASVSLSPNGSRVAVSATSNSDGAFYGGQVVVYGWTGTAWVQEGSDINGEAAYDQSGTSVALSSDGSRVAIGAPYNDGNGSSAGHVRIFDLTGGAWVQAGSDIDGEAASNFSGASVSLSSDGSRVAIGANGNDGSGSGAGHVRVYELSGGGGGGGGITSAPRSLHAIQKSATSRKLSWKAPARLNGGTITDYFIQYRVDGTNGWTTFADGTSTSRNARVSGLTKAVKYQFQVAARTEGGDSPYSVATGAR
jgi:hypothetical protein